MDITVAFYDFVSAASFTKMLVDIILLGVIIWLIFGIINTILMGVKYVLHLLDYLKARRKISRGYGARRLAALAALDEDGDTSE